MEKTLLNRAEELLEELSEYRRYLHENAETGFDLKKTKAYVKARLSEMGYVPQDCGKAGVIALAGKGKADALLLRADMDALPIKEETGVKFACKIGNMHACGHDLHTTMLLGAAKLIKERESELTGRIKLLFQPAEETLEGAKDVIEAGVLKNPDVNGAIMAHVTTGGDLSTGRIVVCSEGVSAPAAEYFTVEVKGKGCHGAAPQEGVDALTIGARILLGFEEILARELAISQRATLTIGQFQGGNAGNAIADTAVLKGTLRAYDEDARKKMKMRMKEIAAGIAAAFQGKATVRFESGCPTLKNDGGMSAFTADCAKKLLGKDRAFTTAELDSRSVARGGGSEDFSYFSHEIPSVMFAISAGERKKGFVYPLHHPKATFDESVLPIGVALFAYLAMCWRKK
ncbi:MAG: amidohydrolase [Clostridia bacterium]|nr:amidohydrolase [Clostridia bacterium]